MEGDKVKTNRPLHGSGKTKFNKEKTKGQSWLDAKREAIANGTWKERGNK